MAPRQINTGQPRPLFDATAKVCEHNRLQGIHSIQTQYKNQPPKRSKVSHCVFISLYSLSDGILFIRTSGRITHRSPKQIINVRKQCDLDGTLILFCTSFSIRWKGIKLPAFTLRPKTIEVNCVRANLLYCYIVSNAMNIAGL